MRIRGWRGSIVVRLLVAFLIVSILPTIVFATLALREQATGAHVDVHTESGEEAGPATDELLGISVTTVELGVAAGSLVLGVIMALWIARTIVRPIRALQLAMGRVEAGDLSAEVDAGEGFSNDEIGRLSAAFDRMIISLRREALIRDLFDQYVSPEVARLAIEREGHLDGELVECSMLFADIRGFTALAEVLPAHRLLQALNGYLGRMLREVSAEGGIVNKFGGDSLLAIFGSPLNPAPDHAARAVRAAIRMRDALDDVNRDEQALGLPAIHAGFGVATGEVIAGNVGSERKIEYTVIGDAVNLAARLQELSRDLGEPILVSGDTASRATAQIRLEPLGSRHIRGRTEPVEVFAARDVLQVAVT
jgi:adenylate cyclase